MDSTPSIHSNPKNFFKPKGGVGLLKTPGYVSITYTPSYITGTSIWVAEILNQKRAVPHDTTPAS